MVDEPKNPSDQKSASLEPPKDIEDLLKELPKVEPQKPSVLPPTPPPTQLPPTPPKPPAPVSPAPKPVTPPAQADFAPSGDKFKSLVRTMGEDLEAAKKGIKPEPKPFEIKPPPGGPKLAPQIVPPPPKMLTVPQIKLGPAEKTKTLELPKAESQSSPIAVPASKKFRLNPKFLILILALIAVFAGAWYFLIKRPEQINVSTPTIAPTPTPTVKTLSELITASKQITIPSSQNFLTALNNGIKTETLSAREFSALDIKDENGNKYSLSQIFEKLDIEPPSGFIENLDNQEWLLFTYGQEEVFDENGSLIFPDTVSEAAIAKKTGLIAKIVNPEILRSSLNSWEITISENLKNLFNLDLKKMTSEAFLDNIYTGTDIRYRNFPFADNSIDYAIVNLPELNADYFVLTNSRESVYSAIDLLRAQ